MFKRTIALIALFILTGVLCENRLPAEDLWQTAQSQAATHRFSTLFTAQDVNRYLKDEKGLTDAVAWCRQTGVTKVYLEVFRGNFYAPKDTLIAARERFRKEGFIVEGCVTPTAVGKLSNGWKEISCYTDIPTQENVEKIFRTAAELFDVVMIDDFWFTDCSCNACQKAKGDQTWSQYRLALMDKVSQERILKPAREVNPKVKIIIKYPEWYDKFHERGYDVAHESELFDFTWIGTETRDPDNAEWGKKPQYSAYWISQWALAFSGDKMGGGWYDALGTTPKTYVEQARQTILGQCRESMLFCYSVLHGNHGPQDAEALRTEVPGLLKLAAFVKGEKTRGIATFKPMNSDSGPDVYLFNFLGMLGLPMTAATTFPTDAPSLLLTTHALADPALEAESLKALAAGKPILITSSLKAALPETLRAKFDAPQVRVLDLKTPPEKKESYEVQESVRTLDKMPQKELDALRAPFLAALGVTLSAPAKVSLYLYGNDKYVLENFNDEPVTVEFSAKNQSAFEPVLALPTGTPLPAMKAEPGKPALRLDLPPRSLLAFKAVAEKK
ncbi:MAG TPA: hypothetical protein PLA90_02245 [Candidatus Sumerlaeota bacterium]|nr:hypothetical protein [Candidatus Sumerlaeota bacterium]